ncbi:MAG: peptide chain release factor 2 [Deltaproteobacteria bacterium]|nr:peptide chain release factor 2 [Deltaproteobacteria bacterium]
MGHAETTDKLKGLRARLITLRGHLDLDHHRRRIAEIEASATEPTFWNHNERAQELLKEQSRSKELVGNWDRAHGQLEDAEALLELAREAGDESSVEEAGRMADGVATAVEAMEFARMLSGPNDRCSALVNINAGAGGTESQDWAEMLLRMYSRWAERKGYRLEILDVQPGEEAGIKSATLSVEGDHAFGFLRADVGVHRLVRISPFDAQARRHTSFASVAVYPDVDDDVKIDIKDEDLRIDVYRSGGAGGQHVNKTESAVRLTHLPTGIVVQCQNERSQHKNKSQAMRVLRARLYEHEMKKKEEAMSDLNAQKKAIEWGSQIRSYVLAPYRLVTDHRTELKVGNVDAVLDGDIDQFIQSFLLGQGGSGAAA